MGEIAQDNGGYLMRNHKFCVIDMLKFICRYVWAIALVAMSFSELSAEPITSILQKARALVGQPYLSGGRAPGGFDCSGFIYYLYRPTAPQLPRVSRTMAQYGVAVEYGNWQPGDLLFYATGTDRTRINHVALWYKDGHIIHSISDGPETGVVVSQAKSKYWASRYISSRRVLEETPETVVIPEIPPSSDQSPWDSFDGILRGDFDNWREADEEAFEEYRKENQPGH